MSWLPVPDPETLAGTVPGPVELVVEPSVKDVDGLPVRRALPSIRRRMVGPFIFLDHMGPTLLPPGQGLDVRPHPHIGLATLTYLIEGSILHRDSLGSVQPILPGAVNWMTAGRGIVHSERSELATRGTERRLTGIQSWIALPKPAEETAPGFTHRDTAALPFIEDRGIALRLIAGSLFGQTSPVPVFSETVYADAALAAGAALPLPTETVERAVYLLEGAVAIGDQRFEAHRLLVFRPGDAVTVRALQPSRLLLLGGEPMDGPRYIWWNFVSSSKDRIEASKADWKAGRFDMVPGEREFIPLPA
jgi:redox-sensitive bicupin YhaK (pirin superfamily)